MSRIVLVPELKRMLGDLSQTSELCDESGTVIATVVPMTKRKEPDFDDAELEAIEKSENWYSTEEALSLMQRGGKA